VGSDKLFQKKKFRKAKEFARQKAKKHPMKQYGLFAKGKKLSLNTLKIL